MLSVLAKHSVVAVLIAVLLEELGIPMPIPTDLLIIFAGAAHAHTPTQFMGWFVALSLASVIGASGLYAIVRLGGRPLVERYGRYVHLGPTQLARSEAWLAHHGWLGIAVGRAIPGLRYVTVVACGLLNVPYRRFVTAHFVGSSVYILVFLGIGRIFGPAVVNRIHTPHSALRLLWLLTLSVGLPLLLVWWSGRAHVRQPSQPSRRRMLSAVLLASFVGATALAASWSTAAAIAELLGAAHMLPRATPMLNTLFTRRLVSPLLLFSSVLLLCMAVSVAYYEVILPRLAPRVGTLLWQVLDMLLLGTGVVTGTLVLAVFVARGGIPSGSWRVAALLLLVIVLSVVSYAITTVYGRVLAIAVLPSLRRSDVPGAPAALAVVDAEAADMDESRFEVWKE